MAIEHYTANQFKSLRRFSKTVRDISHLSRVMTSEQNEQLWNNLSKSAFETYYGMTREVVLEEGKPMIIRRNDEMVRIGVKILEDNGFRQQIK